MKMEPIESSETSAFRTQTPGKYPKENILYKEHGVSLRSRNDYKCVGFTLGNPQVTYIFYERKQTEWYNN